MFSSIRTFLKKLPPHTLFGQILFALLVGLISVQGLGFWLMVNDRTTLSEGLSGSYAAQRIAGIISILNESEPYDRENLLKGLNVPPTYLTLSEPWQTVNSVSQTVEAQWFRQQIDEDLEPPLQLQILSIERAGPSEHMRYDTAHHGHTKLPHKARYLRHIDRLILRVKGQVKLADGAVLTFEHSLRQLPPESPWRLAGLLLLVGVSSAVFAGWAVRRLTRPLDALSRAATGLAHNLAQSPLPETGPIEVVQAAAAFNAMQRDLNQYLNTRAQTLAAISHDLRLPITRLRLRLERLPEDVLRAKMESDLIEMDAMIGYALEFLRAGSMNEKKSRLDINALLESMAENINTSRAQISVHGKVTDPVLVYPQAFKRCLNNLFDNACRYGGGVIDVSVQEMQAQLEIRVEDRGKGIPTDQLEEVFEPYVRLEPSRAQHTGGSGLGLAIARAIAKAHGGTLWLEPRSGGGLSAILQIKKN